MYKVILEWNFGQEDYVFTSEEKAYEWVEQNVDMSDYTMQELLDEGLYEIEELIVI